MSDKPVDPEVSKGDILKEIQHSGSKSPKPTRDSTVTKKIEDTAAIDKVRIVKHVSQKIEEKNAVSKSTAAFNARVYAKPKMDPIALISIITGLLSFFIGLGWIGTAILSKELMSIMPGIFFMLIPVILFLITVFKKK